MEVSLIVNSSIQISKTYSSSRLLARDHALGEVEGLRVILLQGGRDSSLPVVEHDAVRNIIQFSSGRSQPLDEFGEGVSDGSMHLHG